MKLSWPFTNHVPVVLLFIFSSLAVSASAQSNTPDNQTNALATWITLDAPPGWEHLATDILLKAMPGWQRDASGNLIKRKGSGSPRRVIACALDRPGFALTEITEHGYLRLREAGSLRLHPLWTQFHEGQRVKVLTRSGAVPGVVIVKSTHLQRGRQANAAVATLDDLWVDVGASSKADVQRLGIQMLDPVVRDMPAWNYGDYVAGPGAALRVGCAALAHAADGEITRGETIFVLSTLRSFGNDGLEAALRKLGRIDELTVVERSADIGSSPATRVFKRHIDRPSYVPDFVGAKTVHVVWPRNKYSGSLVESVNIADAEAMRREIEGAADIRPGTTTRWISLPERSP